ncbi:MAG: thioredoxin domain-containing protein [Propionibacteriaceae bacterium]|jgi:protein-disulfide isomerase|nr:thioredoxin domain-containing protein [Propionibacteriaceae bacterium]
MAKVKKSEANKEASTEETKDQKSKDSVEEELVESKPEFLVEEEPETPRDPKDQSIRTLQIALGILGAVTICLAIALVILVVRGVPTTEGSGTAVPTDPTPTETTPLFGEFAVRVNPNPPTGAIVVEIHQDYHCGWCGRAEQIYGEALKTLSDSKEIDLRYMLRSFVGGESSQRAAVAATCAGQIGQFLSYNDVIFANQQGKDPGYTDEMLRNDFAAAAGITGNDLKTFQACYDSKATLALVQEMETESSAMGISGTPAFLVNGIQANFPLQSDSENPQPMSSEVLLGGLKSMTEG